ARRSRGGGGGKADQRGRKTRAKFGVRLATRREARGRRASRRGRARDTADQYVSFGAAKKVLIWLPLEGAPAGARFMSLMLESETAAGCTFKPLLLSVTTTPTNRTMLYQAFWPRPASPFHVP